MTALQKALLNQFNSLSSDKERWQWMSKNSKKENITVWLDNDYTFATFDDTDSDDIECMDFDDYIGWHGVQVLLELLNIKCESV